MDKNTRNGFFAGAAAALLAVACVSPAVASSWQNIPVSMGGIQIFIDGVKQNPTDANGNPVEPMIYEGTTYLPVRALTSMLTDKPVSWDGNTQSVLIGDNSSLNTVSAMFASASLSNGNVTVRISKEYEQYWGQQSAVAYDRDYPVAASNITKIEMGMMGPNFTPVLAMLNQNGQVSYVRICDAIRYNNGFAVSGPINGLSGVTGFETGSVHTDETHGYFTIYAILQDGSKHDMYGDIYYFG